MTHTETHHTAARVAATGRASGAVPAVSERTGQLKKGDRIARAAESKTKGPRRKESEGRKPARAKRARRTAPRAPWRLIRRSKGATLAEIAGFPHLLRNL